MGKHTAPVVDASQPSSGVSTRARTSSPSYSHRLDFLELRSRCLHKPPPLLFKHRTRKPTFSHSGNTQPDTACRFRRNSECVVDDDRIKTADDVTTPGSSTKHHPMPTCDEMEEFFASLEKQEQRNFADKYNFDVVNDLPLPGRFEWVKIRP